QTWTHVETLDSTLGRFVFEAQTASLRLGQGERAEPLWMLDGRAQAHGKTIHLRWSLAPPACEQGAGTLHTQELPSGGAHGADFVVGSTDASGRIARFLCELAATRAPGERGAAPP